eukprot:COSAG01_NODE_306_length_19162_cov_14.196611_24_plen_59_part_00
MMEDAVVKKRPSHTIPLSLRVIEAQGQCSCRRGPTFVVRRTCAYTCILASTCIFYYYY